MSILSKVTGLIGKGDEPAEPPPGTPDLPAATVGYTLSIRSDGDYDIMDGAVLAGLITKEKDGDGEHLTVWKAHVREIDATFNSLGDAQSWVLGGNPKR